ncbi:MAG: hypothetical protein RR672_04080, partial [Raoultibacter sp.]
LMYRRKPSVRGALLGAAVGIVCATVVSIVLNFVVMPLHQEVVFGDIVALIIPVLLPFNIIKAIIHGGIALIAFRKLQTLLAEDDPDHTLSSGDDPSA